MSDLIYGDWLSQWKTWMPAVESVSSSTSIIPQKDFLSSTLISFLHSFFFFLYVAVWLHHDKVKFTRSPDEVYGLYQSKSKRLWGLKATSYTRKRWEKGGKKRKQQEEVGPWMLSQRYIQHKVRRQQEILHKRCSDSKFTAQLAKDGELAKQSIN